MAVRHTLADMVAGMTTQRRSAITGITTTHLTRAPLMATMARHGFLAASLSAPVRGFAADTVTAGSVAAMDTAAAMDTVAGMAMAVDSVVVMAEDIVAATAVASMPATLAAPVDSQVVRPVADLAAERGQAGVADFTAAALVADSMAAVVVMAAADIANT